MNKETIGVRADGDVVAALRQLAEQQNRTLSNMAGQALLEYCAARGLVTRSKPVVRVGGKL